MGWDLYDEYPQRRRSIRVEELDREKVSQEEAIWNGLQIHMDGSVSEEGNGAEVVVYEEELMKKQRMEKWKSIDVFYDSKSVLANRRGSISVNQINIHKGNEEADLWAKVRTSLAERRGLASHYTGIQGRDR